MTAQVAKSDGDHCQVIYEDRNKYREKVRFPKGPKVNSRQEMAQSGTFFSKLTLVLLDRLVRTDFLRSHYQLLRDEKQVHLTRRTRVQIVNTTVVILGVNWVWTLLTIKTICNYSKQIGTKFLLNTKRSMALKKFSLNSKIPTQQGNEDSLHNCMSALWNPPVTESSLGLVSPVSLAPLAAPTWTRAAPGTVVSGCQCQTSSRHWLEQLGGVPFYLTRQICRN